VPEVGRGLAFSPDGAHLVVAASPIVNVLANP
jgi:hypothetical protein